MDSGDDLQPPTWPIQDVPAYLPTGTSQLTFTDHICLGYRAGDGGCFLGVVLMAGSLRLLPMQSLSKGRPLEHQAPRSGDDHVVLSVTVCLVYELVYSANQETSGIFLPIMVVTLPLPPAITRYFPHKLVEFLQWFAFWTFSVLLIVPWLFCVYQIVTKPLDRKKRIKFALDEKSAPKTVIVMPVYKEESDVLLTAINSVVSCDYPASCLHVFLSFDGDAVDELYLSTIDRLGVPVTMKDFPKSIDVSYNGARVTISRFPHGGKRKCQKSTFKLIDKIYTEYLKRNDNLFILFIDSDCILDRVCIQNFMYEMELKPGSKANMLAMTGIITATTEKMSLITLLQDMEYIHGQLFERSVESGCGSVTCLPGALTILRFSAFRKMAKYYFADKAEQCEDLFDYGKCHLGEDRWLTHLFMIGAKHRYQIQMCTSAFCKTEAVQTFRALLKQRRRWFLGFITNEVCMLTDFRLWKRYPLLCIVRFMQNTIRTTALLFFIMVISLITTENKIKDLPVGFIAVSLGLNFVLMLYFGAKLRRFKAWLYPLMFILNPFFNWIYMVYGIFTAGQRTWGGPRADAGAADAHTTAQEAIEQAEATGDELNIVPETFKEAPEVRRHGLNPQLLPPGTIEGQFKVPERLPGGWYQHSDGSGLTIADIVQQDRNTANLSPHPRSSFESHVTNGSESYTYYQPRRVESIIGDEDKKACHHRQPSSTVSETGSSPRSPTQTLLAYPETNRRSSDKLPPQRPASLHLPRGADTMLRAPRAGASNTAEWPSPDECGEALPMQLALPRPSPYRNIAVGSEKSPLGRHSPMREETAGSETFNQEAPTNKEANFVPPSFSAKKQKRLQKRRPDTGSMV